MTTPNLLEDLIRMRRRIDALEAAGGTRYGRVTKEIDPDRSLFEVTTMDGGFESLLSPVHIYQPSGGAAGASLWASSPVLSTGSVSDGNERTFGTSEAWSITTEGTSAGITTGVGNDREELYLPNEPPTNVEGMRIVCEVDGSVIAVAFVPWGVSAATDRSSFEPFSALLQASDTQDRVVNVVVSTVADPGRQVLVIEGYNTVLPADTRVLVYPNLDEGGAGGGSLIGSYVHVLSAVDGRRYHVGLRAYD